MNMMQSESAKDQQKLFTLIKIILAVLITTFCVSQIFLTYRGLNNASVMDQAQVARQIARGEGATTLFLRPMDIVKHHKLRVQTRNTAQNLDFGKFADTHHAPLYTYVLAAAIKMTGYDNFADKQMNENKTVLYNGDRVISATSTVFFLISLVLSYILFARLFDQVLASTVVAFMGFSEILLDFAQSGLPQPMMLCLLLLSAFCLVESIRADRQMQQGKLILFTILNFGALAILCLTGYINIWCALGMVVFCGLYFRPMGLYAAVGVIILLIFVVPVAIVSSAPTGGIGHAIFCNLFAGMGGGLDAVFRSTTPETLIFNSKNFFMQVLGSALSQINTMYTYMGAILVTPFFFLSLLNRYKSPLVEGLKWAIFSMWFCACFGMAIFGEPGQMSPTQITILFAPFFTAYGVALVFNFLARMQLGSNFKSIRALTIVIMVGISSGMFLYQFPQKLEWGIWTSSRGIPHYPPYYPASMNVKLHNMTTPQDIIVTDQPWAVAWYADRKALWIPRTIEGYVRDLDPIFIENEQNVQGFLITPTSHAMQGAGIGGIISHMGDFAPLAMEGKILQMVPKHNLAFAELFNTHANSQVTGRTLANIVSSQGQFPHRNFLLGAEMVYYSKTAPQAPQQQ